MDLGAAAGDHPQFGALARRLVGVGFVALSSVLLSGHEDLKLGGLHGVDARTPVVVYDEQSGMRAARAFWFLEYFGHPSVRLLDGGFTAW